MALDINRLKDRELQYELHIRGGLPTGKVDENRAMLRELLKKEKLPDFVLPAYPYSFEEDFIAVTELMGRLTIVTSLLHADQRLHRTKTLVTLSADELSRLRTLQELIKDTRNSLDLKAFKFNESIQMLNIQPAPRKPVTSSPIMPPLDESMRKVGASASKTLSVNSTPIFKWGLKFRGDGTGDTLNTFLDCVERMARSRGVDHVTLFETAYDLFEGPARLWYNINSSRAQSWDELVFLLRETFLPPHYDDDLLEEIKLRIQGPTEPIDIYFAIMQSMFARLMHPPSERQQVMIIKRNLLPFYLDKLGPVVLTSVCDLLRECKTYDVVFRT
uniref:Retrotransposon gag domain-containing protein n=1 Tax=Photinus pyralis TaxID=7054 RepID=A0A1Y1MY35_PHOPY